MWRRWARCSQLDADDTLHRAARRRRELAPGNDIVEFNRRSNVERPATTALLARTIAQSTGAGIRWWHRSTASASAAAGDRGLADLRICGESSASACLSTGCSLVMASRDRRLDPPGR
jgi:hypothetical protein